MAQDHIQGKDGSGKRGGGPRPLAATVGGLAKRALGRRGFAEASLIADWETVVGPELAASCWPDRLSFPPGKRDGGTLRIRAAGAFALELQHLEPQVLQRVNGHFGYRAIERISILQAAPGQRRAAPRDEPAAEPPRESMPPAELDAALAEVEDADVRAALARLGKAMQADSRGKTRTKD